MGTDTFRGPKEAVFPVPPLADRTVTELVVIGWADVTATLSVKVQEVPGATVAPARLTLLPPDTATGVPPQLLTRPFGDATNRSAGKLWVNPTPVKATVFAAGLVMV